MSSDELAKLCSVTSQAVRAKTKKASEDKAEFVEFGGVKYSFALVRKGRGRPAYEYEEFVLERAIELPSERKEMQLDTEQKTKLDMKLRIIHAYSDWKRLKKGNVKEFVAWVCEEFNTHYTQKMHFDWQREYKKGGAYALVDKRGRKAGEVVALDDEQKQFLVSMFRAFGAGEMNFKQLWEELHHEWERRKGFDFSGWKLGRVRNLCDYGVVKRFIENYYKNRVIEYDMITKGEDANKSYNQPAMGNRREQWVRKNQCWEIDSTPADVIIYHENRQMRPDILAIRDAYSGRCVAMLAEKSNALSIIRLLWRAISEFGMPEFIKGDNGRDYVSKQFQGLLEHLGIRYDRAIAFAGDEKGVVERGFRTVQHSYMRVLAGFIGHNVAHRQKIEQQTAKKNRKAKDIYGGNAMTQTPSDQLLSWEDFEARLQEAVLLWEIDKKRRSGQSPLELWNLCTEPLRKISYESFLIYAGGYTKRSVQKDGIHFENRRYIASVLPKYHKQDVYVSENIDNIAEVFVFDEHGAFIGVCEDAQVSSMTKEDFVRVKKEFSKEVSGIRKEIDSDKLSMRTRSSAKVDLARAKEVFAEELKPVGEVVVQDVKLERDVKTSRTTNNMKRVMPKVKDEDIDPFLAYGVG